MNSTESTIGNLAERAKLASSVMASVSNTQKNEALSALADALTANADAIAAENEKDMSIAAERVAKGELKESLFQRLKLDKAKLLGTISGIRQIAEMEDPLGQISLARELDEGLNLYRVSAPIGLVAVIFESRPEAMPQILSLCLKSGNALILKGGQEAEKTNRILFKTMQDAIRKIGLPAEAFALIETRADVKQLLEADAFVDLIIPRGSNELVRFIQSNTKIPVLGHADGICHVYVDREADLDLAEKVVVDSKIQYPSACNAAETLLLHKDILHDFLPRICASFQSHNVELRLEQSLIEFLKLLLAEGKVRPDYKLDIAAIKPARDDDWTTEYCEMVISVRAVDSMQEAILHINKNGSGHTECMISSNEKSFEEFFARVNSAGIYLNASTRFADGFRYGFGAEVGISTSKMHPRGPVGVEGLVTYKYKLMGSGQTVAEYSGAQAKQFTHRDLNCESK